MLRVGEGTINPVASSGAEESNVDQNGNNEIEGSKFIPDLFLRQQELVLNWMWCPP